MLQITRSFGATLSNGGGIISVNADGSETLAPVGLFTLGKIYYAVLNGLAAALAAAGSNGHVIVTDAQAVTTALTVPTGVTLEVKQPGLLTFSGAGALAVNGTLQAGPSQIFSGAGTVTFASGPGLALNAAWWGLDPSGATDCTAPLQAWLTALPNNCTAILPPGTYRSGNLQVANKSGVTLLGFGATINWTGTAAGGSNIGLQWLGTLTDVTVQGFGLNGDGVLANGHAGTWGLSGVNFTNVKVLWNKVTNVTLGISVAPGNSGVMTGAVIGFNTVDNVQGTASGTGYGIHHASASAAERTVFNGVTTSGSAVVTSAGNPWLSTDVGRVVAGSGIPTGTTILTFTSAGSVTLSANATATATGVTLAVMAQGVDLLVIGNVVRRAHRHSYYMAMGAGLRLIDNVAQLHRTGDAPGGSPLSAFVVSRMCHVYMAGNVSDQPNDSSLEISPDNTGGVFYPCHNITGTPPAVSSSTSGTYDYLIGNSGVSPTLFGPEEVNLLGGSIHRVNAVDSLVQIYSGKRILFDGLTVNAPNLHAGSGVIQIRGIGETAGTALYTDELQFANTNFYVTGGGTGAIELYTTAATSGIAIEVRNAHWNIAGVSAWLFDATQTNPNIKVVNAPISGLLTALLNTTTGQTFGRVLNCTVATLPAAVAALTGCVAYVSDGGAGAVFRGCTGSAWVSLG